MAIAFDVVSAVQAVTTGGTWSHVPVGAPRAVVVFITQSVEALDEVAGVSYGGVEMSEVTLSPFLHTLGAEDSTVYAYFLGSGIPVGPQDVVISVSGTTRVKRAISVSMTGATNTEVVDTSTFESAATTAPAATVDTPASTETFIMGALHSGSVAAISPGADYTLMQSVNFGVSSSVWIRRTANGSGGSYSVDWTTSSDEAGVLALAIRETESAQSTRLAMIV